MRQARYSWSKIQETIAPNVSKIVFWKIANKSYEPKSPLLRYKLGLPAMREVEVCPDCGKILTRYHNCKANRPPRIAIRLDNPESAARSIINNMDEDKIEELLDRVLAHRIMICR